LTTHNTHNMTDKYTKKAKASSNSNNTETKKVEREKPKQPKIQGASFTISKGIITTLKYKYKLGPEGKEAVTKYFTDMLPKKTDWDRLMIEDIEKHDHPVGAFFRAYLSDLVYYKYEPNSTIYEPSVSKIRLASRGDTDGFALSHRVISSACVVDDMDIIRDINNWRRVAEREDKLFNHCGCRLINGVAKCPQSNCDKQFPVVLGTENIYYKDVLEGMCCRIADMKGTGYAVFNDYHAAMICKGPKGRALDDESHYSINGSTVTSTVKGNAIGYEHGFLNTGGHMAWQYKVTLNLAGGPTKCVVLFEVLQTFVNGDVPMRLVRFVVLKQEWLHNGKDRLERVPCYEDIFYEATDVVEDKVEVKPAVISVPKLPEDANIKTLKSVGVKLEEVGHRRMVLEGDQVVDYRDRSDKPYHGWQFLDFVIEQFKSDTERLFVTNKDDKFYVNLELREKTWWSVGLKVTTQLFTADLKTVHLAYKKLGVKALSSTIDQAVSAAQRELEKELGFNEAMDLTEAFAIARVIRAQQTERLIRCINASSSCKFVKENK